LSIMTISLTTKDGIELAAYYYEGNTDRAVILVHQNKADASSYQFLIPQLQSKGFHVLALDLRGHGKSSLKYEDLKDEDFNKMFNDVWAAEDYLRELKPNFKIQLVGASIGANLVLKYQELNTVESVVAISPGLNYHGIDPVDSNLSNIACPVFYINSENDKAVDQTKELFEQSPLRNDKNKLVLYSGWRLTNSFDSVFSKA
jgi:esterase/lipase